MATEPRLADGVPRDPPRTQVIVQQAPPATVVREPEIRIYAHSRILYWWPVWVCGDVMTALTHLYGQPQQIGGAYPAYRAARLLPTEALRHD